jgi:uncharacterized membrane protein
MISEEFSKYYIYFMLYSLLGWIWEKVFILVLDRRIEERGFLHLPICIIYGFSILLILLVFYKKQCSGVTIFIWSTALISIVELFTSLGMERLFDKRWWDYSGWIYNFDGRISLFTSIAFGLAGLFVVKFIHPLFEKLFNNYFFIRISAKVANTLLAITVIDLFISVIITLK